MHSTKDRKNIPFLTEKSQAISRLTPWSRELVSAGGSDFSRRKKIGSEKESSTGVRWATRGLKKYSHLLAPSWRDPNLAWPQEDEARRTRDAIRCQWVKNWGKYIRFAWKSAQSGNPLFWDASVATCRLIGIIGCWTCIVSFIQVLKPQ